jgi:hypothetical protein
MKKADQVKTKSERFRKNCIFMSEREYFKFRINAVWQFLLVDGHMVGKCISLMLI